MTKSLKRGLLNHDTNAMLDFMNRIFNQGHLLKSEKLRHAFQVELGDVTFKESYKKTG